MKARTKPLARIAALRALTQRFSFALLVITAVVFMMVGKVDTLLLDHVRTRLADAMTPIMDTLARPAGAASDLVASVGSWAQVHAENQVLAQENEALRHFQAAARNLAAENAALRQLVNYTAAVPHAFITARVIADNGGAFVRSIGIGVGDRNGVRDGLAVIGARGLIGRTVQTGDRSSRVLLLTDLNARIPVLVGNRRDRAILAGDNTQQPRLLYLPPESAVAVGSPVATSGHDGMFPPGIPVGLVASMTDAGIRIELFEEYGRLEYVRIIDFQPYVADAGMREPAQPSFFTRSFAELTALAEQRLFNSAASP